MKEELENLRQNYTMNEFSEALAHESPFKQFEVWFAEAAQSGLIEPNAMAISTASPDGKPSSRMVLLKGFSEAEGFIFYTNYHSRKGNELLANPHASLLFWWPTLERQVRIEGNVLVAPKEVSDAYFRSRPTGSKLGAAASPQSQVLASREELEGYFKKWEQEFPYGDISRPENWGGYMVQPTYFEFWQGRTSRLHDRITYTPQPNGQWLRQRLAP
jgi:pyridoxamine 5'-phosphate oxidase